MSQPIKVNVKGLVELRAKLKATDFLGAPFRDMLESVRQVAEKSVVSGAPRHSGKLARSIKSRVSRGDLPRYVIVKATATRSSKKYARYAYPRRLEFSLKSRHHNWMQNRISMTKPSIEGVVHGFGQKLKGRWGT